MCEWRTRKQAESGVSQFTVCGLPLHLCSKIHRQSFVSVVPHLAPVPQTGLLFLVPCNVLFPIILIRRICPIIQPRSRRPYEQLAGHTVGASISTNFIAAGSQYSYSIRYVKYGYIPEIDIGNSISLSTSK